MNNVPEENPSNKEKSAKTEPSNSKIEEVNSEQGSLKTATDATRVVKKKPQISVMDILFQCAQGVKIALMSSAAKKRRRATIIRKAVNVQRLEDKAIMKNLRQKKQFLLLKNTELCHEIDLVKCEIELLKSYGQMYNIK